MAVRGDFTSTCRCQTSGAFALEGHLSNFGGAATVWLAAASKLDRCNAGRGNSCRAERHAHQQQQQWQPRSEPQPQPKPQPLLQPSPKGSSWVVAFAGTWERCKLMSWLLGKMAGQVRPAVRGADAPGDLSIFTTPPRPARFARPADPSSRGGAAWTRDTLTVLRSINIRRSRAKTQYGSRPSTADPIVLACDRSCAPLQLGSATPACELAAACIPASPMIQSSHILVRLHTCICAAGAAFRRSPGFHDHTTSFITRRTRRVSAARGLRLPPTPPLHSLAIRTCPLLVVGCPVSCQMSCEVGQRTFRPEARLSDWREGVGL